STTRAGYTSNEVYPNTESPDIISVILKMYAESLVNQIFSTHPKIINQSSHVENLLIWGDGRYVWTDFSDHVLLDNKYYPQSNDAGNYLTPKEMLSNYLHMVVEIPGYREEIHKSIFYQKLNNAFLRNSHNLYIDPDDTYEQVVE